MLTFYPEGQTSYNFANVGINKNIVVVDAYVGDYDKRSLELALNDESISDYLENIAYFVNKPARDATLRFEGGKIIEFQSAQNGQELRVNEAIVLLNDALKNSMEVGHEELVVELPVIITRARIANEEINNLGIKELIGSGVSYFAGSITNRIHNINLGASLVNGVLVKPGESFSLIEHVGGVTADQGFKQAYVIKSGRTVLDDGGGICQVSTTVFRAALNSGLPIVSRTAHAYRVSYYEQRGFGPGLDATIFSPTVVLKFKNDTENHILVQTTVDNAQARLQVDIYGTSDGRRVEISKPVVSNVRPAPEPLYQDDPTLPKGTVKQVDFPAAGATSVFSRKVYKGSDLIIDESFRSVFRPWQAVYLVGKAG
jgi:vancomycin resistance protein YoaR